MYYILISCSAKKALTSDKLRAVDLYTGVFFGVYKKALKEYPSLRQKVKLLIISAKYGLIEENDIITTYDLHMNNDIALKQRSNNTRKLQYLIERDKVDAMTVAMGRAYIRSVNFASIRIPTSFINGGIGIMLHKFKECLAKLGGDN